MTKTMNKMGKIVIKSSKTDVEATMNKTSKFAAKS